MGNLPTARVNRIARVFVYTSVDYTDSIAIRTLPVEGIYRKRSISCYSYPSQPKLLLRVSHYTSPTFIVAHTMICFSPEDYPYIPITEPRFTASIANYPTLCTNYAHAKAIRDPNFRNLAIDGTVWYFLRRFTSAVCGRPALKVLSII